MTAPTLAERTGRIRALIEALETKGYRVPAEQLRHASYVPGWSVRVHGHGLYNVDVAGQASAVLTRDDTLALLLARWVEAARAEVYAHENDVDDDDTPTEAPVTDGITEAAKMEEATAPVTPSSAFAATTTATDRLADLVQRTRADLLANHDQAIPRVLDTLRAIENGLRGAAR